MDEQQQRANVVKVAREYVGTPYHHSGKIKGVGVDCGTFLMLVFVEAGIIPSTNVAQYSNQWHLHREDPLYEKALIENGSHQVDALTGPGDIVLYFQGKQFAHGAIVTQLDPLRIIHAYAPARRVVEGGENEFGVIAGTEKKFFTTW